MKRRLALVALIGGLLLAAAPVIGSMPSDRTVVVRVAEPVERVELTWWRGDDAIHHTELAGSGETTVSLHDGEHRLELEVFRHGGVHAESRRIEVMDGADRIVIEVP